MVRKVTAGGLIAGAALALSMVFSPARPASAQQGITWSTGFQVQNLGSGSATVTIQLINPDGTTAATIPASGASPETIGIGGSKTYFPIPNVSNGFSGSAIISATQPVAAILNIEGNGGSSPFYSEAATGITEGSTSVRLPLILRNNGGNDTWFAVQNVGDTTATDVKVSFKALVGTSYTTTAKSIPAGASLTFDQSLDTALGDKFVGSAVVTSSKPLAVIVNQVGKGATKVMYTYSGFAKGSSSVALPLIQQSNGGNITGISVQNSGTIAANVTVTYSANLVAGGATLAADTAVIQPGASSVFFKGAAVRYVGSAVVTATKANAADTGTPEVVVVVNQLGTSNASAYEGLNTASATSQVSLPLLLANNDTTSSGVQCVNLGPATKVTLTYSANLLTTNPSPAAFTSSTAIGTNKAVNIQQSFTYRYVGSGKITTDPAVANAKIVCIVNQVGTKAGDNFKTYDGINY